MPTKRKRIRNQNENALLVLGFFGQSDRQVFWIKNKCRKLRSIHKSRLGARNVLLELEQSGQVVPKFSWLWKLAIALRRDLHLQISDVLIAKIIIGFHDFETKRLDGEIAIVGGPGTNQYLITVGTLNSTFKEVSYWLDTAYSKLDDELTIRIEGCKEKLGVIARQDISGMYLDYAELDQHSFYFNALVTILVDFKDRLHHIRTFSQSAIEQLYLPDHAVIYYMLYQVKPNLKGEEQKRQVSYLVDNELTADETSIQNFSRYVRVCRTEKDLSQLQVKNRLTQLDKIGLHTRMLIKYPKLVSALTKEKNFYTDHLVDPEGNK